MSMEEGRLQAVDVTDGFAAPTPGRMLARQAIFNGRCEAIGYELLFREGWENSFSGRASESSLAQCLLTGVELLTDNRAAFVSCTRQAIVSGLVMLLPAKLTVIEIAEPGEVDEELMKACRELRTMGYKLALDDFMPLPEMQPLVEIVDYVKVDFLRSDAYTRRQTFRMVRMGHGALVANKLETPKQFQTARSEGYEYFQGPFFCLPAAVANREVPANRLSYVKMLAEMNRTPLNLRAVAEIVQMEPALTYRVLRLANSAMWARHGEVTSIQAAFMLVGEERFRALVSVAAASALADKNAPALIGVALERARFCELTAPLANLDASEQFMLGLLSLLDAMLEMPMETIVTSLPLRDQAKDALLGKANAVAVPLRLIKCLETGDWERCAEGAAELGIREEEVAQLYVDAVKWATESVAALK
jgi:c-di-GMP-related signal transduction protein